MLSVWIEHRVVSGRISRAFEGRSIDKGGMMGDLKDVLKTPLSEGARRIVKTIQWIGILFWFSFIFLSLLQGMPEDIAETKVITILLLLTLIYLAILILIFPLIVKVVVWVILGSKEK